MIKLENVTKKYDENIGLDNVSIVIEPGEFVFLVGPSGAGKSTFIKLLLREIQSDTGNIFVDGENVTKMSKREIPFLRRRIGIVFQDFRLLPKKTVFENVAFAMEIVHNPKAQIELRVNQALDLVGIRDKKNRYPNELSAGEQQRVAIARAIINKPELLIADEPTGNLDPNTAKEIMTLLDKINESGTTIVMVTHAKDIVDKMEKRVVAIENGKVVSDQKGTYSYKEPDEDMGELELLEKNIYKNSHGNLGEFDEMTRLEERLEDALFNIDDEIIEGYEEAKEEEKHENFRL